jgi:hypothetical protein
MPIQDEESSTWGLLFTQLSFYVVPDHGAGYQKDVSLVKPSPDLARITEHIKRKLEEIGEVELVVRPDIFPPIYRIKEADGSSWNLALPILLNDPPRPFDDLYEFVLPETNP